MRSPLATSASRLSLHAATAGIIPTSLMGHAATQGDLGIAGARLLAPGAPERSVLLELMRRRDSWHGTAMRRLVTAGARFIGRWLVERLLARGDEVLAVDDLSNGRRENVRELEGKPGFLGLVVGDIKDPACIKGVFARESWDAVFHLGASIHVQKSIDDPEPTIRNDTEGTFRVLEACLRQYFAANGLDIDAKHIVRAPALPGQAVRHAERRRAEDELATASAVPTSTLLVTGAALPVAPNILSIAHWDRLRGGALYAPLSRVDWATLLRRTSDVDVTRCTGCGGRMTVRAVVTAPVSIDRLLAALRRSRDAPVAA